MTFESAVRAIPDIGGFFKVGLKGVKGEHRAKLVKKSGCRWQGSINLDESLARLYSVESRWDYAVGFHPANQRDRVAFVEIHPASTGHVSEVLRKKVWLLSWLARKAPQLNGMSREGFFWVSTDGVHIQNGGSHKRLLAQSGIRVVSRVVLG
ncbi:MAG: hypothetical protein AABZ44_09550 [Elusimicrobiota bacterium]